MYSRVVLNNGLLHQENCAENTMFFHLSGLRQQNGRELGGIPVVVIGTTQTVTDDNAITCMVHKEFVLKKREVMCISTKVAKTGTLSSKLRSDGQHTSYGVSSSSKCSSS